MIEVMKSLREQIEALALCGYKEEAEELRGIVDRMEGDEINRRLSNIEERRIQEEIRRNRKKCLTSEPDHIQ